ncbi:hypothetical protein M427DRAFT_170005 [Gonapodya prolifera JEL478]|uniref:L domain-like protein n=1 Tax=Gonapodya prolifera (strain JEL478) TaxID=1344416 RepID=A0A139B037_GONPJ|nr:hypothetical protein M427DRAFT_170005 [Gonapodya prolifera JEL478]|eukprot:KXS22327.1 hypothetical protein M427DRAFT_170005 [Gonapodya prolifera JEL478]
MFDAAGVTPPWSPRSSCCRELDAPPRNHGSTSCTPDGHITGVDLSNSKLAIAFPSFAGMPFLRSLVLDGTGLYGPVPPNAFAGLSQLSRLDIHGNALTGAFPDLSSLPLTDINVQGDSFDGNVDGLIPATVANCNLAGNSGLYSCSNLYPSKCGPLSANCTSLLSPPPAPNPLAQPQATTSAFTLPTSTTAAASFFSFSTPNFDTIPIDVAMTITSATTLQSAALSTTNASLQTAPVAKIGPAPSIIRSSTTTFALNGMAGGSNPLLAASTQDGDGPSLGVIVGGVVGAVAIVAVIVGAVVFAIMQRRKSRAPKRTISELLPIQNAEGSFEWANSSFPRVLLTYSTYEPFPRPLARFQPTG